MALPQSFIPEPLPLSEVKEVSVPKSHGKLRPILHPIIHHIRTVIHYVPFLVAGLAARPRKTLAFMAVYYGVLQKVPGWKDFVHSITKHACSNRPRAVNCLHAGQYDPKKQYVVAVHPHGFLADFIFNLAARAAPNFKKSGEAEGLLPGLRFKLCFAPAVGWYPLYSEICGDYITDASAKTVRGVIKDGLSPMVCPGGFSEACYTGASKEFDFAYLAGRSGFIKLAIENGLDIAPLYCFGCQDMYDAPAERRHSRSVWSQKTSLPGVWIFGKMNSAVPLSEDTCMAILEPFPASKYTVDQLDQCAMDYITYLGRCFDTYKSVVPSQADKKLLVIGRDVTPQDALGVQPHSRL